MNIILDTKSRIYKQTAIEIKEKNIEKTFGFAIKLSILDKYGISISSILQNTEKEIVIDAEYQRLDTWLTSQLDAGLIKVGDLNRLIITVQAKRIDSEDQLNVLRDLNVSVILVTGHKSYLKVNEIIRSGVNLVAKYYQKYSNIRYLGISAILHDKLNNLLDYRIQDNKILELYGDHKLMNSSLWIYYVGNEISDEARNYVNRRSNNGQKLSFIEILSIYCVQNQSSLDLFNDTRSIYVYLDVINKNNLFETIKDLTI